MDSDKSLFNLENQYYKATGKTFDFLTAVDIPKSEIPSLHLIYDNCYYDIPTSIKFFIEQYRKIMLQTDQRQILELNLLEYYQFYSSIFNDKNFQDYIRCSAHIYLNYFINRFLQDGYKAPLLPKAPLPDTLYIDLASGFNFIDFIATLDPNTFYVAIDKSYFTCQCLLIKSLELKLSNLQILNIDIHQIEKSHFNKRIGTIRAKNIYRYLPDFNNIIPLLQSMIESKGLFVIQEQSDSDIIFKHLQDNLPQRFFSSGWRFNLSLSCNRNNPYNLDSLYFYKEITSELS